MITGGQAAVARATAAVFVDGWRAGSAVLVDSRYLVTAAHVLQRWDPGTRAEVPVAQVELEFPGLGRAGSLAWRRRRVSTWARPAQEWTWPCWTWARIRRAGCPRRCRCGRPRVHRAW